MATCLEEIAALKSFQAECKIHVYTLGQFAVYREGDLISEQGWGRDKTMQLFQFLVATIQRNGIHREQISDRIWEDDKTGDFKVALHGINKVLEPQRAPRSAPAYLIKQGHAYQLNAQKVWVDTVALEKYIAIATMTENDVEGSIVALQEAIALYKGLFLPSRVYEDWSAEERERVQVIVMGAYYQLAEMQLQINAMETIRLTQNALAIDPSWEDVYRLQMSAYIQNGNRPQAIKTYQKCKQILDEEYGLEPLPETNYLLASINAL